MGVMTYQARFLIFAWGCFSGARRVKRYRMLDLMPFCLEGLSYLKRRKGVKAKGDVRFRVGGIGKLFPSRNLALHPF